MKKTNSVWTAVAGVLTSILAFFGIVSCCGMPIIAGALSLLGIGASQLSFFADYKWWFIAISVLSIIWGFVQLYGKKKACCCSCANDDNDLTSRPPKSIIAKVFLWIGTILTAITIIYSLSETKQTQGTCCPSESELSTPTESCCGASDETEIEFENHSAPPQACCGDEESTGSETNCCTQN